MLYQIRNAGLIVFAGAIAVIMLSLATLIAIPVLIAATAFGLALRAILRARVEKMIREQTTSPLADVAGGETIEGEWTVLDLRDRRA